MKKLGIFFLIFGIAIYFYINKESQEDISQNKHNQNISDSIESSTSFSESSQDDENDVNNDSLEGKNKNTVSKDKTSTKDDFVPQNEEESSLHELGNLLQVTLVDSKGPESLVQKLKDLDLDPIRSIDSNPHTGSLSIVRTKKTLPGTRYIHAQYFEDENNKPILQHMSFEFKPGPNSMERALTSIRNTFNVQGPPKFQRKNFMGWDLDGDYIVWLHKLGPKDLKNNPFNAYSKKDIGTIRIALELEIHGAPGTKHLHQSHEE